MHVINDYDMIRTLNSLTNDLKKIKAMSIKWAVNFDSPKPKIINLDIIRKHNYHMIKFGFVDPVVVNAESHTHMGIKFSVVAVGIQTY